MRVNMGGVDRGIRIVVGLAAIGASLYFKSWWGLVGLVPLGTGITGFCPGYVPFRFTTRKGA
jgi:hypothetical protein